MARENRPTIIRLAVYWIFASGMMGLIIGLAFATGVVDWAYQDLDRPVWLIPVTVLTWLWVAKTMWTALILWMVDRFGHGWCRWASMALITLLFTASGGWITGFVILRDLSVGFYAILVSWTLTVLTMLLIGRAHKLAGVLMWPVLIWTTYMLAVSFELMRLNTGLQMAGL